MGVTIREKPKGSGVWWVFIHHAGQRRARRVGTGKRGKRLAEAAAIKIQARLLEGDVAVFDRATSAPLAFASIAFEELAEKWLEWYPSLNALREGTVESHRTFIRAHLKPFFGATPVSEITRHMIQEFIAAKRATGGSRQTGKALADSTLLTSLPTLKLIFDYAMEGKLITSNPMSGGPRLWRPGMRPEHVDPFTGPELRAILAASGAIQPDSAVFFRLWMQSGMRSGEARALWRGDLDFNTGEAHVQRSRTKGRVGPTKTGRTRLVSILHPVCEDTPEWRPGTTLESRAVLDGLRHLTVTSLDPDGYLFGKPLSEKWLHRLWRRLLTKAGVRYREPEQLRHTWASTMLSRNAPLLYVAQQGGWKNAGVLLKHYARWMPQMLQPTATQVQPNRSGKG